MRKKWEGGGGGGQTKMAIVADKNIHRKYYLKKRNWGEYINKRK